jgi:hypothetical protein
VALSQLITAGVTVAQKLGAQIQLSTVYTNGTGTGQLDLLYSKQLTFVASTPQTLTLSAIADMSGATVAMLRVREFWLQVVSGTIIAGAAGTHPWSPLLGTTGTVTIGPGPAFGISDPTTVGGGLGLVVASGSSDQLKLDPGSSPAVVNVLIGGCSATS